jgi:alpha-1,3-glucosyltransferase
VNSSLSTNLFLFFFLFCHQDTSEWTLDYPPLFAWFEWLLSHIAAVMDPKIVQLSNLYYNSWCCIVFQRLSVVVSDLVLAYAIKE